jgi:phosphoglycerate dehydrogenase-like enzyme
VLILISDAFDSSLEGKLKQFGEVTTDKGRLSEADVILVRSKTRCDKEYIDSAKKLKLIIRGGVGVDNIDVHYAETKNVVVRNTPKSSAIAVAELTMALMLSVPTNLIEIHNGMREGKWLKGMKRTELYGKTLALLGAGNIAKEVAKRASAFGMNIVAYDKYVTNSNDVKLVSTVEEAVESADYISMHLPLTDETYAMICDSFIHKCQNRPVIINTGRGLCIDAQDMVKALDEGTISWYATDVYPSDPPADSYPLLQHPKVTLTPHVGASSEENLLRIGDEVISIIEELLQEGAI